jgi:hypothetical protein
MWLGRKFVPLGWGTAPRLIAVVQIVGIIDVLSNEFNAWAAHRVPSVTLGVTMFVGTLVALVLVAVTVGWHRGRLWLILSLLGQIWSGLWVWILMTRVFKPQHVSIVSLSLIALAVFQVMCLFGLLVVRRPTAI